ncbi:MAG: hypothetical protein QW680_13340, partial [Pyrobaculum sp.]
MRPVDYVLMELEARRRAQELADIRPAVFFRLPWGGTAPPPQLRDIQIRQEARLAAPGAGVVLALPEVLGIAPLGRIIYALASGKPLEEVEREYFGRLYQGSVWQIAGYDVDKMRRDVEGGSLSLTVGLLPLAVAAGGKQGVVQALKYFAVGGGATAGATTPIAALQGRPLPEIQQIALESFISGGVLADIAALGRHGLKALADRLKTMRTRADVLDFVKRTGGDQAAGEFLLRYNAELDAFRAEANKLSTAELLKLRERFENALKEFEANKTWRLDEPVWKIRDKLDVIDEILRSRPTPTSDVIDLQYAASLAPPGPPPKVKPPEIKDLLKKIGRARTREELADIEVKLPDLPGDVRALVESAIQKRLAALARRDIENRIATAKTREELADIERKIADLPPDLRSRFEQQLIAKLEQMRRPEAVPDVRPETPKIERVEPKAEGGRAESPRRGGQVLELLTREEQAPRATPKARVVARVKLRSDRAPKAEDEPKPEGGQSVKTESEGRTQDRTKTDEGTGTEAEAGQVPAVKTAVKAEADAAPVRVSAVPANAVLYAVTPAAMVYRAGDTFYAVLKSGDILMYPPGKAPPGVGGGGGGGGGWVPY